MRGTGLFTETPGTNAQDVQWVLDWARKNGKTNSSDIRELQRLRKEVFEEKDGDQRAKNAAELRQYATDLRERIEEEAKQ